MSAAAGEPAPPGQSLRSAREARGLSLHKAADELRLTAGQITAMEEGRYDSLGPAVFARGHLRRYAALLGLAVEPLLEDYESVHHAAAAPTLVPPASLHTPVAERKSPLAVMTAVLVPVALAGVVAGAWWLQGREPPPPAAPVESPAGPAASAPDAAPPDVLPATAAAATPAVPEPDPLAFEFADSCWIEVYDATGRRLAFELAERGARRSFAGPAPWRVELGNVRAARMTVDGRHLPLPGHVVLRNTASIYVDEAGTVARVPAAAPDET